MPAYRNLAPQHAHIQHTAYPTFLISE